MTARKRRSINGRFVHDGRSRLQSQVESDIRPQVIAEYSERLAAVGLWKRFWLRLEIDREVRCRASKMIPPDALY